MALIPAPTLGSPGVDQLSPAHLLRTARLFASDPALRTLVDPADEESRWVELDSNPDLEIWLLSWPPGTHNGWHDHGDSAGAFQVVSGTLLEQTSKNHRRVPDHHRRRRSVVRARPHPQPCQRQDRYCTVRTRLRPPSGNRGAVRDHPDRAEVKGRRTGWRGLVTTTHP